MMRSIETRRERYDKEARELSSGPGIDIGSGATRARILADALMVFMQHVRKGLPPMEAYQLALAESRTWVARFNGRVGPQVRIWSDVASDALMWAVRELKGAVPAPRCPSEDGF